MTPQLNRALFPLRSPRTMTLQSTRCARAAWLPWEIVAAAIDGYVDAFFAVLVPPGSEVEE